MSSAPGWYKDPADPTLLRWWAGTSWTQHVHDPRTKSPLPDPYQLPPAPPSPPSALRRASGRVYSLAASLVACLGLTMFAGSLAVSGPLSDGYIAGLSSSSTSAIDAAVCRQAGNRLAGYGDPAAQVETESPSGSIDYDLYERILGSYGVFSEPGCLVTFSLGFESYPAALYSGQWSEATSVYDSLLDTWYQSPLSGASGNVSVLILAAPPGTEASLYRFELYDDNDTDADFEAVFVEYASGTILVYEPWYVGTTTDVENDLRALVPLLR